MRISRYKRRYWAVYDGEGVLVCVCLFKKGAREVIRRLQANEGKEDLCA